MKAIRWILVVVVVGSILTWFTYRKLAERRAGAKQTEAVEAEKQQWRKLVSGLAQKWNAVRYDRDEDTEWDTLGHTAFTVDIEECLIRPDGHPVLIRGSVEDVQRRGDKYVVHIDCWRSGIHCLLECDAAQVGKFRSKTDVDLYEFAVIAKITSVKRPFFQATATTESGDAEIAVDSPKPFVATGVCLDLVGPYKAEL